MNSSNDTLNDNIQNNQQNINIELGEDMAQGTYANLAIIAHSASEFVIDYVRLMPGVTKAKVKSRIIMTPENAKSLYLSLGENIQRYEQQFSPININGRSNNAGHKGFIDNLPQA
ncbi:MAG: DUF3467 domain-containing protein [Bacteroidales bacterium]